MNKRVYNFCVFSWDSCPYVVLRCLCDVMVVTLSYSILFCRVWLLSFEVCCFLMRDRKGIDGCEGEEELRGVEVGKTGIIIRIYYMREFIFNKTHQWNQKNQ